LNKDESISNLLMLNMMKITNKICPNKLNITSFETRFSNKKWS